MNDTLKNLTIDKAQKLLSDGVVTSVDIVNYCLSIIEEKDKSINAFREVFDDCIEQAKKSDEERLQITTRYDGDKYAWIKEKPLLGMPVSLKDNILLASKHAGASSLILENYIATYDSTVVGKLKGAGAIFIGRVNMDEFAMGGSTENSAYGVTKNPYDSERVAGGSSGGSTASVAMDGALVSLGSDTGGSIRQPAAYCGVVGLKPTYGSVSRHGLMAMGSSLDIIGPITKTVGDAKIVFDIIKGQDVFDSTSHTNPLSRSMRTETISALKSKDISAKSLVIGIIPKLMDTKGLDPIVAKSFDKTIEYLRSEGVKIKEIDLPRISYSLATYYVIMPAEVSSNMGRFDGMRFGSKVEGDSLIEEYMNTRGQKLGKEVRRRIMLGAYVLSAGYYDAYYNKANMVRELLKEDFNNAFKEVDIILTPTAPSPAFKIGENSNDPIKMYLEDVFTVPANLVGSPAISVPVGFTTGNPALPLAIQCMAPHGAEELLFAIGRLIESMPH